MTSKTPIVRSTRTRKRKPVEEAPIIPTTIEAPLQKQEMPNSSDAGHPSVPIRVTVQCEVDVVGLIGEVARLISGRL